MSSRYLQHLEDIDADEEVDSTDAVTFVVGDTLFVVATPTPSADLEPALRSLPIITVPRAAAVQEVGSLMDWQDAGKKGEQPAANSLPWDSAEATGDSGTDLNNAESINGGGLVKRNAELAPRPHASTSAPRLTISPLPPGRLGPLHPWPPQGEQQPRSRWPGLVVLTVVLLLVGASTLLTVFYQRQTQRDLQALHGALHDQRQAMNQSVIQEVRRELRALPLPDPQEAAAAAAAAEANLRAVQELDRQVQARLQRSDQHSRQAAEQIRRELAQQTQAAEQRFTEQREALNKNEQDAALLTELRALKGAVFDLQARTTQARPAAASAAPPSDAGATESIGAQATLTGPVSETDALAAEAVVARARLGVEAEPVERPAVIYLVDASGELSGSIPEVMAEVRRLVQRQDVGDTSYTLMLYGKRLLRVGDVAAAGATDDPQDPSVVDLGPADLTAAMKVALEARPGSMHLISGTLSGAGGGEKIRDALSDLNRRRIRIDVTQFHFREGQNALKQIAREHNGFYAFIPAGS